MVYNKARLKINLGLALTQTLDKITIHAHCRFVQFYEILFYIEMYNV